MCSVNKHCYLLKPRAYLLQYKLFGYIDAYNSAQHILIEMLVFLSVYDTGLIKFVYLF
jgi:hypothetical protein